jgi:hypothetical protein
LWADAVCINQADDSEKAAQIPLMVGIFKSATRVVAHIASAEEDETRLKSLLESTQPKWDNLCTPRCPKTGRHDTQETDQRSTSLSPWETSLLFEAVKTFDLQWFNRRWIIQEVVFNKEVLLVVAL